MDSLNGEIQKLGQPLQNTFILHCVKSKEDGKDALCFSVTGSPGTFVVYDVNRKKPFRSIRHNSKYHTAACWTQTVDKDGNVYFGTFGSPAQLFRYDCGTKELQNVSSVLDEEAVYHLTCGEDGSVYGGTYPGGKVFRYQEKNHSVTDYGCLTGEEMYCISSAYYKGKIYGGTRSENPKLVCLNLENGERRELGFPPFLQVNLNAVYYMTRIENYLFPVLKTAEGTYYILCYDLDQEMWTELCEQGLGGQHISQEHEGNVYFVGADGELKGITLDTMNVFNTGIAYHKLPEGDDGFDYANGLMGGGFFWLEDQEKYPGYTYITSNYDHNALSYINFENKTVEFVCIGEEFSDAIQIKALASTCDGDIVFGGYMGTKGGIYRCHENSFHPFICRQTEGITSFDGKVYMGIYTRAVIWELDLKKPFAEHENPKPIFRIGEAQDRPFALCEADGLLVVGTVPDYGTLGGALTIYNPRTGEKRVKRHIIKNQSITSLCYQDGIIYGSSGIWGGLGSNPTETDAKVFAYDLKKEKLLLERTLQFDFKSGGLMHIGGMGFDGQGNLWGVSAGIVFRLNPDTLDPEEYINISRSDWDIANTVWKPASLVFDGNILYCNLNEKLTVIDLRTKAYRIYDQHAFMMAKGGDGNIYFSDDTTLCRFVPKREHLHSACVKMPAFVN